MYNYGARYYDPKLSLWMGVDPLASYYPNMSPYSYVANNPINYIDPTGMWIEDDEGNLVAQKGDSACTLEEQMGIPFEVGDQIIQDLFGPNLDNGTDEGQSNIHPGDKIRLTLAKNENSSESSGWLSAILDIFRDVSSNKGGWVIFAEGSNSGWSLEGNQLGSNGKATIIDISDMLTPGGKISTSFARKGSFFANLMQSKAQMFKSLADLHSHRSTDLAPDSIWCDNPYCNGGKFSIEDTTIHKMYRNKSVNGKTLR